MASKKVNELEVGLSEISAPSMIADAIRAAAELGGAVANGSFRPELIKTGVASETEDWYLLQLAANGTSELVKVPRQPMAVQTEHASLRSFTDWVVRRSGEAGPTPEVFIGEERVTAQWNLANHSPKDAAWCPLTHCEAWNALKKLIAGVGQKDLHKLLTTVLHGCIDERLSLQVAMLSHYVTSNCDVAIARTGLADISVSEKLQLRFTGGGEDQTEEIGVLWVYEGRVWSCFEQEIRVPLRMVIAKEKDAGLRFEFAPLGLEGIFLEYRAALASEVSSGLAESGIPVYVGRAK